MNRRKFKYEDYNKSDPTEEATKIFIVYEGRVKEPNYFEAFNKTFIDSKKAFICHILEEDTGIQGNTPLKLKDRVIKFIENPPKNLKVTPNSDDKFRFVLDIDKHSSSHFEELKEFCDSLLNGGIYISNFCFEVWLWSHFKDLNLITSEKSSEIKEEFGRIQSENFPHSFMKYPLIKNAIERCEIADIDKSNYLPVEKSSKVYLLIKELLEYSLLNLDVDSIEV